MSKVKNKVREILKMKCPKCNSNVKFGSDYCSSCGEKIDEELLKEERKKRKKLINIIIIVVISLIIIASAITVAVKFGGKEESPVADEKTSTVDEKLTEITDITTDSKELTTLSTTKAETTVTKMNPQFLEATEQEIKDIENGPLVFRYWGNLDEVSYDSETATMSDALRIFITDFFGSFRFREYIHERISKSGSEDPLRYFDYSYFDGTETVHSWKPYYYASKEEVDWVAKNLLNVKSMDFEKYINKTHDSEDKDYVQIYYHNGNYYSRHRDSGYTPVFEYKVSGHKRLADGKYEVYLDRKYTDLATEEEKQKYPEKEKVVTLVAALKELHGKRVWSYYKVSGNK